MFGNETKDYKQLKAIRAQLTSTHADKRIYLNNLMHCGSKVIIDDFQKGSVALIANNKSAKFYGVTTCKSPWCCPVCTARVMSKHATDVACAIDALKQQGQTAVMITFTIPHTSGFSCEQSTEILYNSWKAFTVHGNKILSTAKNDIFSNFMAEFHSKHRVRVCEYTWGSAGWHPHFHCLFWFPTDSVDKILDWEEKLNTRWLELTKRYTIKQLLLSYPTELRDLFKEQVKTRVDIMYDRLNEESQGIYISKKDGKVIRCESSQYILGWGYDKEITGNPTAKATKENHYSWQQILEKATANDENSNIDWWSLFFEYALATKKYRHTRINYSVHSGIKKIISEWKKTQTYKETQKKSATALEKAHGKWRTVCWFTSQQWSQICSEDLEPEIIKLAILENALEEITKLLEAHNIAPPIHPDKADVRLSWLDDAA